MYCLSGVALCHSDERQSIVQSILAKLNLPANITAQIAAAKAAELALDDDRKTFPEFEIKPGESRTISILPGLGSWIDYAVTALDDPTDATVTHWVEDAAAQQFKLLGFDTNPLPGPDGVEHVEIPEWAAIPAGHPAAVKVSGIFLPKAGAISYSAFPQKTLDALPPDHPRRRALQVPTKFGAVKVKHSIIMYCIEHPLNRRGLDDAALAENINAGGFLRLLKLNMPSYSNLKEAKAALLQLGKTELPSAHLIVSVQDPQFVKLGFQVNPTPPVWRAKPELLALVLQEVHRVGPVATKTPYRELTDDEFAAALTKALDAGTTTKTPEN